MSDLTRENLDDFAQKVADAVSNGLAEVFDKLEGAINNLIEKLTELAEDVDETGDRFALAEDGNDGTGQIGPDDAADIGAVPAP